ncbi:16S rRNA processing protein RimM [Jatrophihabitans endophyticus]|uniref:Ribosome maturation factor RimM n=1 Tax=Jatrophihabitans endophyticus TaxID=1206085 RepID=A0A1M5CD46_9ACTN|nr:ribosome maturation factor RimM [Jatrophihabitans endophyticus]SHF52610.1 16S rRNA processing protein RimM [Jatrophihabitans endophyticus]
MSDDETATGAEALVAVGRVGPARGVRGDLFVEPWTDAPEERFAPGSVLVTEPTEAGPLTVETAVVSSGKQVVHFLGVDGRVEAEALRGVRLFVAAAHRPALADPDEFYDTDLIGLTARTVDGAELGPVVDITHAGGADYLVVAVAGTDRLVPFVAAIVPAVDVAAGIVTVDPPAGLFEL